MPAATTLRMAFLARPARLGGWLLVVGAALSLLAWQLMAQRLAEEQQGRFRDISSVLIRSMEERFEQSIQLVLSFGALFSVSDEVSRRDFHHHALRMRIGDHAPGLIAIQYSPLVPPADKTAFEAMVRADDSLEPGGYPDFLIHPPGDRPFYVPILYNEPMARNRAALGHDTAEDPVRRQTMEEARMTGLPAVSPPLQLLQGDVGVVIRLAVFHARAEVTTPEARQAAYLGQVGGVFRVPDVLRQAIPHYLGSYRVRVLDVEEEARGGAFAVLHDNGGQDRPAAHQELLTAQQLIQAGGRMWRAEISRAETHPFLQLPALLLLAAGTGISLGLFWLGHGLDRRFAHARAEAVRLHHGANHDSLTGLANRRGLLEQFEELQATSPRARLALLFLDLDRFKPINDRHGHAVGDEVLRLVAGRLLGSVRPTDVVARLGGDEFVILMDSSGDPPWSVIAARVEAAIGQPMQIGGHVLHVGASVGVALHPEHGRGVEALLRHADQAMYALKRRNASAA